VDVAQGKDFEGELAEPARVFTFDQKECRFIPHVGLFRVGTRLAIKNSDDVQHNAKGFFQTKAVLKFNPFSSSKTTLPPSDETTLDKAGNYLVGCDIHLWMSAYLRAIPHPYYAISGVDGTCTFTNVPPGEYRLACWHEGMFVKLEMKGPDISGYRYSEDFHAPEQVVTVPAGGTVDAVFTIDPR
jgi:plastocyanin